MKNNLAIAVFIVISLITGSCSSSVPSNLSQYVNPFIGTGGHGHTFPGATMPFGMVQLSPNTRLGGWDGVSGYHYTDSVIYGFTHTALNGTGVGDYCDILLMPVVGLPEFNNEKYLSPFRKETEKATAGYYSVFLDKPQVQAELTATKRAGVHRYTFPKSDSANVIIDLFHRDQVLDSKIEILSDTEIRGMRRSSNWAKDMTWYFHIEFSKPFAQSGIVIDNVLTLGDSSNMQKAQGKNIKAYVRFQTNSGEAVEVKVGLSAVDPDGAYNNLKSETSNLNFDAAHTNATNIWNSELSKIKVKGGTLNQDTIFYTALYHAMLQPNTFMDVDKRYRGMDHQIHTAENFTNYTVFSLWDTYRAWHPLMTILEPAQANNFVLTMLNMYEHSGVLPVWELAANETWCMIGNHAISVIVDAYMKGIRGFDQSKALKAMQHSVSLNHFGLDAYRQYGYVPGDKEHESVSKTLEYAYNDWCIAQYAKATGNDKIYAEYIQRAQAYKNILDVETGFARPRINGNWLIPFNPSTVDWNFTEANSWQYSFYVPHDITGFYTQLGGKERMIEQLDKLFTTENKITGRDMKDISGLIGQYAHGNEPSHHMAYLYNFVNQPWKTQQYVRRIMDEFYLNHPEGLIGNEDCGQMSAWLLMSAMGFYPVTPGSTDYIIGTPWFPEMEIQLQNGKTLKITANNVSTKNCYIKSVKLNGQEYKKSYISHQNIVNGGHLHFEMDKNPNKKWATADNEIPVTAISEHLILPAPVIHYEAKRIKQSTEVTISTLQPGAEIHYTTDGTEPTLQSKKYTAPLLIDRTTTIKAIADHANLGTSKITEANLYKIDINRKIELHAQYNKGYHADGPEGLIDGIRGTEKWRLGGWQGYQDTDFEAVVDLGKIQHIRYLGAGFLQSIGSWIWMPVDVAFYVSSDGKTFKKALTVKNTVSPENYETIVQELGKNVNTQGRYIKVQATNFGEIPSWHLAAGGEAFIFIDEIVIK